LSEAFSHDPFERRVKSTYAFVQEILSLAAERSEAIRAYTRAQSRTLEVPIRSEMVSAPDSIGVVAELMQRTGDSTRTQPGVPKGRRRTGKYVTVKMPVFDRFKPTLTEPAPTRYVVPAADTEVVRALRAHGIQVTTAEAFGSNEIVGNGYVFTIDSVIVAPRPFQNHREIRLVGKWRRATRPIKPGSFIVDTTQQLGLLAIYMLEPQSDDGLVDWNFFDKELKPGGEYPVFKVGGAPPSP
jgi:hypothetical protein